MHAPTDTISQLGATSQQFARLLLTIGENRLELLAVALQEERDLLLRATLLTFAMTAFGLLAGIAFTGALVLGLWAYSPVVVLLTLTILYGAVGGCLYGRLTRLRRGWHSLSSSLDQVRKDREGIEGLLP